MPQYLDNIWGDQAAMQGFGQALNNNFARIGELRQRQKENEQHNALQAAYFALERQKQMMAQPGLDAETRYRGAETDQIRSQMAIRAEQEARLKAIKDAVEERFLQANPSPGGFMPQGGQPQTGQPPMQMPPPTGPMAPPPWQGPQVMSDPDQARLAEARLRGLLSQQAAQNPDVASKLLSGDTLRPGDQRVNPMTQQLVGEQTPGFISPYQSALIDQRRIEDVIRQQMADAATERAAADTTRANKPPKESFAEKAMREAAERKKGGGGKRMTATNPVTNERIVSDDGGQTWQPMAKTPSPY